MKIHCMFPALSIGLLTVKRAENFSPLHLTPAPSSATVILACLLSTFVFTPARLMCVRGGGLRSI